MISSAGYFPLLSESDNVRNLRAATQDASHFGLVIIWGENQFVIELAFLSLQLLQDLIYESCLGASFGVICEILRDKRG